MLSGDNSILQKATDAKQTSERAEAKEQAQMDIMAYIADKTANQQDASLDNAKIKEILSDNKSYVKTANDTSFTTAKGEYEIPYSELYAPTETTPVVPTIKYGLSDDGKVFIGKLTDNSDRKCDGNVDFENGYKFTEEHFILVEDYDGMSPPEDAYFVWDSNDDILGSISSYSDLWNCYGLYFDIYDADGNFYCGCLRRIET